MNRPTNTTTNALPATPPDWFWLATEFEAALRHSAIIARAAWATLANDSNMKGTPGFYTVAEHDHDEIAALLRAIEDICERTIERADRGSR